ncbi:MAG: LysE family transporter [Candidatus Babeliales bacterium]
MNIIATVSISVLTNFLKGALTGAFIAIPVGPIGIVCLRRLLTQGALMGIASGFGSATADALYAVIALLGLSVVAPFLQAHTTFFRIASALFLCALGLKICISRTPHVQGVRAPSIVEAYFSTFFLTVANPLLIFSFATLGTLLDIEYAARSWQMLISVTSGVFCGSAAWWVILGIIVAGLDWELNPSWLRVINTVSGLLIVLASIAVLVSVFFA